jgi:hypothetical protein
MIMEVFYCYGKRGICTEEGCPKGCEFYDDTGGQFIEQAVTNADRIRTMSDEELAKFLECFGLCHHCTEHHRLGNVRFYQDEKCDEQCEQHCLEWLKQPAEDDNVPADQ